MDDRGDMSVNVSVNESSQTNDSVNENDYKPGSNPAAFLSPPVPFISELRQHTLPRCIRIDGILKETAKRFDVNLCHQSEIYFHFNPRFNERRQVIVLNNTKQSKWQTEERHYEMPFERPCVFSMHLLLTVNAAVVLVNKRFICSFKWRNPAELIDHLKIKGDVELSLVVPFTRFP